MAKRCRYELLSLALAVAFLSWAGCGRNAGPAKEKEAPRVTVAHPAVRELTDEDDYNGWLVPFRSVDVRARVRGHIKKVYFKDGDIVKKGDPLFDIDPAPFEADIKQAEAEQKSLEAQKSVAEKDVVRYTGLAEMGGVSKQQLEKSHADVDSYTAQIAAKRAQIDRLQLELKYSKITADLAGKISKANLTEGNLVNAGGSDPLLTTIVTIDPIYVDFNIDERAMQRYQETGSDRRGGEQRQALRDQHIPFTFGLDTDTGFPHKGRLVFSDNKYAEGTGTILVRGEASNPDGRLIPGSRVRVRIAVSDKYAGVIVPDTAVLSDQTERYLLVLSKDNKVLRRNITPGRLLDDGMRVILPGPDDKKANGGEWAKDWEKQWVITVGLQRARINYPVLPLDAAGQPVDGRAPAK